VNNFRFINNVLHVENVSIKNLSKVIGTPFYCYSTNAIIEKFNEFKKYFNNSNTTICYAIKANPNIAILKILSKLGCGAEAVSLGEILRALKAGIPNNKIVFSGVGKSNEEIQFAVKKNLLQINVESLGELDLILKNSHKLNKKVNLGIRINPDIDAKTHNKITTGIKNNKFGIDIKEAENIFKKYNNNSNIRSLNVSVHIGSQITSLAPFFKAFDKIKKLVNKLNKKQIKVNTLDLGGGVGISYKKEKKIPIHLYAKKIKNIANELNCRIILEPGRILTAESGILVSKVLYLKKGGNTSFAIIDSGMNDLIRPALYDSEHDMQKIIKDKKRKKNYSIVGPICETADTFIKKIAINELKDNDIVFFNNVGAYGASMSSSYNSRPIIPEILVYKNKFEVIRKKENIVSQISKEKIPSWI
tara:strand:+ start:2176 stop:3429 length:1254 start_codon:yes stop_codon:yes gene_type:complete